MTDTPALTTPSRRSKMWRVLLVLLALFVLMVVGLLLAHAIWRGKARARADAMVATIVARGEPMSAAELIDAPVPDDQNIVVLFKAAQAAYVEQGADLDARQKDLWERDPNNFRSPLTDDEVKWLREANAQNAAALKILDGLSERHQVAWDNPPTSPILNWLMPEMNQARTLANLLADQSRVQAYDGDFAGAIQSVRDLQQIAYAISKRPTIIGALVSHAIDAMAAVQLLDFAPDLQVSDPKTRAAVEAMITTLLDDGPILSGRRRGLIGERVMMHDAIRALVDGKLSMMQLTGARPTGAATTAGYFQSPLAFSAEASILD